MIDENPPVIWRPLAGSQTLLMSCTCNHILYAGTRGGGKTDSQLMYFRRFVGIGYGAFWRGVIFDLEYKNLDDLIAKSKKWFNEFNDGARFINSPSQLKWIWPTGEELWFRVMKTNDDYWKMHGQEFSYIGWNELSKHPNSDRYDDCMSLNRSSFLPEKNTIIDNDTGDILTMPEIPLVVLSTTNPYGVGHAWIKRKMIDVARPGQVLKTITNVFNPRTQQREDITKTQVYLFGAYKENVYLSPEYVAELESITDINKRKAWLYGDWDITSGGMFDDVWSSEYNIVSPFQIPLSWKIFRSFDWGSSAPFSVGWWAESDGCDARIDNKIKSTIKGDLYRIGEWYGWTGKANKGLRMLAPQIAKGIVEREIKLGIHERVKAGPADNSINDDVNGVCIAQQMGKRVTVDGKEFKGVTFTLSNKKAGSRKQGWELMRIAIANAQPENNQPREFAGLFVFRTCQDGFIRTVPGIPRSAKDLDDCNCWVEGTLISTPDGEIAIEKLKIGDFVNTPMGPCRVTKNHNSGFSKITHVKLTNGLILKGTSDHPVVVKGVGLINLIDLKKGMILIGENESWLKQLCIKELLIGNTAIDCILQRASRTLKKITNHYTEKFIKISTVKFLKKCTFIILMETMKIMKSKTYNYSVQANKDIVTGRIAKRTKLLCLIKRKKCEKTQKPLNYRVKIVDLLLKRNTTGKNIASSVLKNETQKETIVSRVRYAILSSFIKRTQQNKCDHAVLNAVGKLEKEKVYNLTIELAGLYYANNVLSSNTDAEDHCADESRYVILSRGNNFSTGSTTGMY